MEEKEYEVSFQLYTYIKAKNEEEAIKKFLEDNFPEADEDEFLRYISCEEVEY